jgi:biopolymer transport protein ExbD
MGFMRKRRAGRANREEADLNVTPFMNLMIVLVPVLLLSLVFTHTSVIDLNFPSGEASAEFDPEAVHLEVAVHADRLVVGDGRGGAIRTLPVIGDEHDYATLSLVMQELKKRMPQKRDITLLFEDETSYQTLVHVMDVVRSQAVVQGLDVVQAELFPVVSLGTTVQEESVQISAAEEREPDAAS